MNSVVLVICLVSLLAAVVVAIQFHNALRILFQSKPFATAISDPLVSVVIPARNEERDLAQGLESVLAQTYGNMQVMVINDHSTDRTGDIARAFEKRDSRLRVLHDPELPPGWLGKHNAMQQAARQANGKWLIFTDADVIHQPECFAHAIAELEADSLDLLSYWPLVHCVSFWENLVVPTILVSGFSQFVTKRLDDPNSPDAMAGGAFILVRPEAFWSVGGFESIRQAVLDDVELARLMKRRGFKVRFRAKPDLLDVRLFKGNHDAFWGTTKNILLGLGEHSMWLAPVIIFLPTLFQFVPILSVILGCCFRDWLLTSVGVAAYLVQYGLIWMARRMVRLNAGILAFYPLASIAITSCMIRSLFHYAVRGSVVWRNRSVRLT